MDDLFPLPDTWRDSLATYPREAVFTVLAAATFAFLLLLTKRPRIVLRGLIILLVAAAGLAAGLFGTRTGVWAERTGERGTVIGAGIVVVALVFALRLRITLTKVLAQRRLVRDVKDDPQRLLVLALAPEIGENARRRAVKLLTDPFTLDEIARRSRSNSVKKLARRRLVNVRSLQREDDAKTADTVGGAANAAKESQAGVATGVTDRDDDSATGISPEAFYLPPE